ncbi:hypothetical protein [Haloplanus salinarum]|uniref:hypothetical protein n=1 Tax=Haloplanus salinarum TaxID=1912324 RepID=UPI003B42BA06
MYFSPCGKSSLIGTCHATISYRLPSGFSSSSRYTTVAGIVLLCWGRITTNLTLTRASGTQPLVRLTAEGRTDDDVERLLAQAENLVATARSEE